jgi:hypothetical protein
MTEQYYSPGQIRYLRDDIIWMIAVVLPLEAGQWPLSPVETGYVGNQKTPSHAAPFETPGCIRAEVEKRIKMAKSDGETLVWEIQHGFEYYELLCPASKMALNYISSGPKRRKQSYREWKKQSKYRHKSNEYQKV